MHIHIIGICGTFMAGIASLACAKNYKVTGCDENIYPPMSDILNDLGIEISQGYQVPTFEKQPDLYIVGNAGTRGMPIIEDILTHKRPYLSGPEWLYQTILRDKKVIAISGTHGKTTTSSLLTWTLECAGLHPSFLIGGVPTNFGMSARLTESEWFVIEADEYDTAFFDKRSKMVHYRPDIALVNNVEFDHADIFDDLAAILKQFHGMLRLVPKNGVIVYPHNEDNVNHLLEMGTWSRLVQFNNEAGIHCQLIESDGSRFYLYNAADKLTEINWHLIGLHNVQNALAVFAICSQLDIAPGIIAQAFNTFKNVKRRLEIKKVIKGVTLYDDFAHHPTAIALSTQGLRAKIKDAFLVVVVDFGSHTMRSGTLFQEVLQAIKKSDKAIFLNAPDMKDVALPETVSICSSIDELQYQFRQISDPKYVLVMSNKANQDILDSIEMILNE